jgi:hypothetical protein
MISAVLLPLLVAGLPERVAQRYRVELGGESIGWASLSVTCDENDCRGEWMSGLRAPETAGGRVVEKRVRFLTDRNGRARKITLRIGEGAERSVPATGGRIPASLAELLLSGTPDGERRCLDVFEEESGRLGRACGGRTGQWIREEVLGLVVRVLAPRAGAPLEVLIPDHRIRFAADSKASLPVKAPALYGVEVPMPAGAQPEEPLRFCGVDSEGTGEKGPTPPIPDGLTGSCREQTAAYAASAVSAGFTVRHVVGPAWDGRSFTWHEWAEVRVEKRWLAVDPTFRQAPAEGARFVIARFTHGDDAERAAAGAKILSCWGRASIVRVGKRATR